jgi:hypothetical protein
MRCEHCSAEIDDAKVLSHAASLRSKMRKTHKGAKPRMRRCPRCGVECAGEKLLLAHLSLCAAGPLVEITPADLQSWEQPNGTET